MRVFILDEVKAFRLLVHEKFDGAGIVIGRPLLKRLADDMILIPSSSGGTRNDGRLFSSSS